MSVLAGFSNISKVPELRRRVVFTMAMLAVFRIGAFVDLGARVELLEHAHVDGRNDVAVVLLEAALRKTTRERGLAAFEPRLERGATGELALLTAASRLAETGADAAALAKLAARCAFGLRELAECISHCPPPRRSRGA